MPIILRPRPSPAAVETPADQGTAPSDAALVARLRDGDAAAFELVMRRYNRLLFRIARSVLPDDAEAEDVVQETYLRAYERLGDFVGPRGFATWLCRIASNEALGRRRRGLRLMLIDDRPGPQGSGEGSVLEHLPDRQPDPEGRAVSSELRRILEDAIDRLPEDYRRVFMLRAVEGLSVAETAALLEVRPEVVKTRLHRARARLREILAARHEAVAPAAFDIGGERCDRIVAGVFARLPHGFVIGPKDPVR